MLFPQESQDIPLYINDGNSLFWTSASEEPRVPEQGDIIWLVLDINGK